MAGLVAGRRRSAPVVCGLATMGVATLVILGWASGWTSLVQDGPGVVSTKANTAVCLMLLGLGVLLTATRDRRWSVVCGTAVFLIAGLTLLQYVFEFSFGIDTLLFGDIQRRVDVDLDHPGRMPRASGRALLLIGAGLALLDLRPRLSRVLVFVAMAIGYLALTAQAIGAVSVNPSGAFGNVSAITAVSIMVVGTGIVWLHPDLGLLGLLQERGPVGGLVRGLCVFAIAVPPVVGAVRLAGEEAGLYSQAFGLAVMVVSWTIGVLVATWLSGRAALPVEKARDEALAAATASEQRLELVSQASAVFGSTVELDEVLDFVSVRVAQTLGDACEIRLVDPTGEWLVPVALHHVQPDRERLLSDDVSQRPSHVTDGNAAQVLRDRQPLLISQFGPEAAARVRDARLREGVDRLDIRSLIITPLICRDQVLGTLSALRDVSPTPYDDRDTELLSGIADRGAQAIFNARVVAAKVAADSALAELARLALDCEDPDHLTDLAVALVADTVPARHALILDESGGALRVVAAATHGIDSRPVPRGSVFEDPAIAEVVAGHGPRVYADVHDVASPGLRDLGERLGAASALVVPVPGRDGIRTALVVATTGIGRLTSDDLHFVEAYAGLLGAALARIASEAQLRIAAVERQSLLDRVVSAQEEERGRIADGVHDDQVQAMAALGLRLGMLRQRVAETSPELIEDLDRVRTAVIGATQRLRDLLFDLQPPDAEVDLVTALEETAAHVFHDSPGTAWSVEGESSVPLPGSLERLAFRIAKEALVNAGKHADATSVRVRVTRLADQLQVEVLDDGIGLHPSLARSPTGHHGLSSMQDRAAVAGGSVEIEAVPGAGTRVMLRLPVTT